MCRLSRCTDIYMLDTRWLLKNLPAFQNWKIISLATQGSKQYQTSLLFVKMGQHIWQGMWGHITMWLLGDDHRYQSDNTMNSGNLHSDSLANVLQYSYPLMFCKNHPISVCHVQSLQHTGPFPTEDYFVASKQECCFSAVPRAVIAHLSIREPLATARTSQKVHLSPDLFFKMHWSTMGVGGSMRFVNISFFSWHQNSLLLPVIYFFFSF